jgi:hypothetical protein
MFAHLTASIVAAAACDTSVSAARTIGNFGVRYAVEWCYACMLRIAGRNA